MLAIDNCVKGGGRVKRKIAMLNSKIFTLYCIQSGNEILKIENIISITEKNKWAKTVYSIETINDIREIIIPNGSVIICKGEVK